MSKPGWHPELSVVVRREDDRDPPAECRGAPPEIDRDIVHLTRHRPHQLALGALDLIVQTAQGAPDRPAVVVLNKIPIQPGGPEFPGVPRLHEEAAVIAVYGGLEPQHLGNCGGRDVHG